MRLKSHQNKLRLPLVSELSCKVDYFLMSEMDAIEITNSQHTAFLELLKL